MAQNAQISRFELKVLKTNARFETSTSKTEYKQSFIRITKIILFGPKCSNMGIWAQDFREQMSDSKSVPWKQGACESFLRLESYYVLTEKAQIWAFGLITFKKQMSDMKLASSK